MSPLLREWHEYAREAAPIEPGDQVFVVEDDDPRVPFKRRVVLGGIVDARPSKPGVLFLALTSDGGDQQLGVSSVEQARNVVRALTAAFGEGVKS